MIEEEQLEWLYEAIEDVDSRLTDYHEATTIGWQAYHYMKLIDAIADLRTYHPRFDLETGTILDDNE